MTESIEDIKIKYNRKVARTDGSVAAIVGKQTIPKMCKVRQKFDDFEIKNLEAEIISKFKRPGTIDRIKPGQTIAITAGSRGISNIARIIKAVVDEVKKVGGKPFIIPAMGSHGGATAEGQLEVLESYNITEKTMGCPIHSSMETVQIGVSELGKPVRIDKFAFEADGIIVVGRVKPHTSFRGKYESGLIKMVAIGLGKQFGAEICHSDSFAYMEENITTTAKVTLEKCKILFGLAIVENAYDKTRKIEAIPSEKFFDEEPALQEEAKKHMPSILTTDVDVLIVDEIGKNISGDGMDPNVTGTFSTPYATGGLNKQRTIVLNLTEETHGNGYGIGAADFSVQRVFDKMDFEKSYPNSLTSTLINIVKLPMILANDRLGIQAAIKSCCRIDYNNPRVIRIKNSLKLDEIYISESLIEEAKANPQIEVLEEPRDMVFDENGNLF
jgi:hypothetical protein